MRRNWIYLLLFIIVLVEALATGNRVFFILLYLLLAIFVLAFLWSWGNIWGVSAERVVRASRTQVGRLAEERLVIRNSSPLPKLWVDVRDHSDLPNHRASFVVSNLGSQRQRTWTVRTICRKRGRFALGPMTLITGDPFGFFQRTRHISQTQNLVVYPATVDLPYFALPLGELPGGGARHQRTHYVTTNVSSVRDYFPGDSFNRIHWRSTARTGRLIVKEFELDPTADVWIFLDMEASVQAHLRVEAPQPEGAVPFWDERYQFTLEPSTEEYGVLIAASIAKHFLARNRAVGLLAYGQRRELLQSDRGERQLNKILETLAVLRAQGDIPIAETLASEGTRFGRNTTVIVITPSTDVRWVNALRDLDRRGIRGVGVVLDATSFGGAGDVRLVQSALAANGILSYHVREGDAIAQVLTRRALEF